MTISIDTVCTEQQLADELGGQDQLSMLLGPTLTSAQSIRVAALRDVLRALTRRDPPINESDLQDPTELREAVLYGACERLYRLAMTTPDSVHATKRRIYEDSLAEELRSITPTLAGDLRGSAFSWRMERG